MEVFASESDELGVTALLPPNWLLAAMSNKEDMSLRSFALWLKLSERLL